MFEQFNIPTKRQIFERDLKEKILNASLKTDKEVYLFTLGEGFLPRDTNKVLEELKQQKAIYYSFNLTNSRIHNITLSNPIQII